MKYQSINEFFDKPAEGTVPMEEHLDEVVGLQIAVIDTAVNFGKWLCGRFESVGKDEWKGVYMDKKIYSTSELFQMFNSK